MKTKRIVSILLSILLAAGVFSAFAISPTAADDGAVNAYGAPENIEGGLILHCWCWNFNNIKANMKKIAEAGYAAVQTSPINAVYDGREGMELYGDGKWYYQYQPIDYTIGNYQLGTEEEFKAMCDEAHKYGVKVIVDVVANHTTGSKTNVASSLKNIAGGLYHTYAGKSNDDSRINMTQWYDGLPDANTQNPNYQQYILKFLKQAVADGADGFRYDTAKHIELPDDDESFASDFWPVVLENGSTFQYGEVLQGVGAAQRLSSRLSSYAKIMHVTASAYGVSLRTHLKDSSKSATALKDYDSEGVTTDRLVTWVESHDTYANDLQVNTGSSFWLTNTQIRLGWAILTARGDTTSLFFSRPYGSEASEITDRYTSPRWGTNQIGDAGDDNYFDPEIVALNKFHNLMLGESSEMVNANGKKHIVITRGDKGAVLVNTDKNDYNISFNTTLPDGTYTDTAHGDRFVIYNGVLQGTVNANSVAVIYNAPEVYTTDVPAEYLPTEPVTEPVTTAPATEAPKTTLTLAKSSASLYAAQTITIKPTVKNSAGKTTYTSSDSKIAKVSSAGKVTALKKGKATITVKNGTAKATFKVTVKNPKLKKSSITLKKKGKYTISITGKAGKQTYKSTKPKIAKVSSKGKVTALKSGKAKIKVTTNGGVKLTLSVKVK